MSIRDDLIDVLRRHAMPSVEDDMPKDEYECCADAILDRFGVVELPEAREDDDGQLWFHGTGIRVDRSGSHGPEVYLRGRGVDSEWLRGQAAEYLAAAQAAEETP